MVVLIDRLSKGIVIEGLKDIKAKIIAKWFLTRYYPYHYLS
jgi:hypothetical protein